MKSPRRLCAAVWLGVVVCGACSRTQRTAELVLENGAIYTLDPHRPWAEAIAIADGQLIAVGTVREIDRTASSQTTRIDLDGRMVVPGFHDAQLHLVEGNSIRYAHRFGITSISGGDHARILFPPLNHRNGDSKRSLGVYDQPVAIDAMRPRIHVSEKHFLLTPTLTDRVAPVPSSEWPLTPVDPMLGIHHAITGRELEDKTERRRAARRRLNLPQALKAYTLTSVDAAGLGHALGSLEVGKIANICVLSENLFQIPVSRIPEVRAEITIVDGRLVFVAEAVLSAAEIETLRSVGLLIR